MRLLWFDEDDGKFKFADDFDQLPPYTILSHTWGDDKNEVSYQDIRYGTGGGKAGWQKLSFCARRTKEAADGLKYFWVDTCCINKRNEAELSYAIRSMFRWYKEAAVCFVYLSDVQVGKRDRQGAQLWKEKFRNSRWFQRGWTLQELLAPKSVQFYSGDKNLGDRNSLCQTIHEITGIEISALQSQREGWNRFSHITRLQWARTRETKVPEDLAYCLAGLCDVSIDPKYGEGGEVARKRLERKIIKQYGTSALDSNPPLNKAVDPHAHRDSMLEWLKFDSMDSRRTTIRNAHVETCGWILSQPVYRSWLQAEALQRHHGFFWIKGKPGAGKSVLVKFLDTHVSKTKAKSDVCISFYFNARGESLEKSFIGMYRSLLLQLLMAVPALRHILDKANKSHADSEGTVGLLQRLMLNACLMLGKRRMFCFIDALDECKEEDVSCLIEFFQDLGQSVFDAGGSVFVCFASRHYPVLHIPTGLELVLEDTKQHTNDLEIYARQRLRVGTAKQTELIMQSLLAKASGVFLWVVLVVDILNKEFLAGRNHAVQKRLDDIPAGLSALFRQITIQHNDNMDEHLLCLRWILYARRPLALEEFHFAMMAGLDDEFSLEWDPDLLTTDDMQRFLVTSSKGLAELTKGAQPKAQFIHESVRDFLLSEDGLSIIQKSNRQSSAEVHEMLKQCCVRGMRRGGHACKQEMDLVLPWNPSKPHAKVARERVTKIFPFLDYAIAFVLYHSDQAATGVPQYEFLQRFALDDWLDKANFLQSHVVDLYKRPLDLVYVCAERDFVHLLTVLANHGHSLTTRGKQRWPTPLFAALSKQCKNAARLLLERCGATNAENVIKEVISDKFQGKTAFDRSRMKPLLKAVKYGHDNLALYLLSSSKEEAVVENDLNKAFTLAAGAANHKIMEILLGHGADVNGSADRDGNALYYASWTGNLQIVNLLLEYHADVDRQEGSFRKGVCVDVYHNILGANTLLRQSRDINAQRNHFATALQAASSAGQIKIVETLLQSGADINAQGGLHGDALQAASSEGHIEIVKTLLGCGADINAQGGLHGNALQAASSEGHIDIVKTLLRCGADINAQGGLHGNALQAAIFGGHSQIVETLLLCCPDVNARGGVTGNALETASSRGYVQIVEKLLHHGANVTIGGGLHGNALIAASTEGHLHIVDLLLQQGANVNSQEGYYGNALQAASHRAHYRVAELLLERGADVNARGGHYGNALQAAAAAYSGDRVSSLLLTSGADVNAVGGYFSNALQAAAAMNQLETVQLLLGHGADPNATGGCFGGAFQAARAALSMRTLTESVSIQRVLVYAMADRKKTTVAELVKVLRREDNVGAECQLSDSNASSTWELSK